MSQYSKNVPKLDTGERWGQYIILERTDLSDIHVTYSAVDPVLERHVSVKLFHRTYSPEIEADQSFKNFVKRLTELKHPHISSYFSAGHEQDVYYVVTDYIQGYTLQDWLDDHRVFNLTQSKRWLLQVVDALDYASAQNFLHLNIKPIRFIVNWDNITKIANVGLIQCSNILAGKESYDCLASPHYASPEHISGKKTDLRTDMYCLGATLFHLLTGTPPFEAETSDAICRAHLVQPFPANKALEADIHPGWIGLMEKLMEKKPEDRFQSYKELAAKVKELPTG
jgi:serine/threonine-protein kinase